MVKRQLKTYKDSSLIKKKIKNNRFVEIKFDRLRKNYCFCDIITTEISKKGINGQQADFYTVDENGNYISHILRKNDNDKAKVKVTFDSTMYTKTKENVLFQNKNSNVAFFYDLMKELKDRFGELPKIAKEGKAEAERILEIIKRQQQDCP